MFDTADLERWAGSILNTNGASSKAATVTARSLVDAERRGIETHGLAQLRQYLPRLRSGAIDGAAQIEVVTALPALAVIDGHNGLGAYVMDAANDLACSMAHDGGAAVVLVRNSNHFGTASWFSENAALRGCFALVVSNSDPGLAPAGALAPILGTNPLALAAPSGNDCGMPSLDIATSVVALGKVRQALREREAIPLGWAIGPDGQDTNDPETALEGSMLPMGGHKGFGLAFMIDVLVGAISGSNTSPMITSDTGSAAPQRVGHAIVAVQVDHVRPMDDYAHDIDTLAQHVKHAGRAASTDPFLIPGEKETRTARGRGNAILLAPAALDALQMLGAEYGCPFVGVSE